MIAALLALFAAAPPPPADATGLWRTPRGAEIRIERCGPALCGRIETLQPVPGNAAMRDVRNSNAALRSRPLKGLPMLTGFTGGPARWSGGQVYNPEDGRTYSGSIELLNAQTLKLTGCALRIFCRSQQWRRVG